LVKLNGINKQRVNNLIYFLPKKEAHYADRDFRPFLRLRAKTRLPPTEDILEAKAVFVFHFSFTRLICTLHFFLQILAGEGTKKS